MRYVVLASSINAIGALFSVEPKYEYFPLDENHPYNPEDGYSVGQVHTLCIPRVNIDACISGNKFLKSKLLRSLAGTHTCRSAACDFIL